MESGDPRYVICDMVDKVKADFLVMGSHGHGAMKRYLGYCKWHHDHTEMIGFGSRV